MNEETHISDLANELFGLQTALTFQFYSPNKNSLAVGFDEWLRNKGYFISKMEPNTMAPEPNVITKIVFNQLFTLDEFVENLEIEGKWGSQGEKDNCDVVWVSDEDDYKYLLVRQDGDWKFGRQRPIRVTNWGSTTSGYAGSSSFSSYAGYTGSSGMTGTTGSVGSTGVSGKTGHIGPTGSAGFTGSIGISGASGSSRVSLGTSMSPPVSGPSGPTGPSGPSGSSFSLGTSGPQNVTIKVPISNKSKINHSIEELEPKKKKSRLGVFNKIFQIR